MIRVHSRKDEILEMLWLSSEGMSPSTVVEGGLYRSYRGGTAEAL